MRRNDERDELAVRRHLLVLEPGVFRGAPPEVLRRFADRLTEIRRETVLVLLGDAPPDDAPPDDLVLPEPDYFIDAGGGRIVRASDGDVLADWPGRAGATDEPSAVEHLAGALMVSDNEVFVVATRGREALLCPARTVTLDAQAGSAGGTDRDDGAVVGDAREIDAALERLELFLPRSRRMGALCDEAFERAVAAVRANVTDLGFTAASVEANRLLEHEANYAAVWARDGVITGLWTLCLEDDEIDACFRRTLRTLADHQSVPGQVPANVRLKGRVPEYAGLGGIASIDAVIWFVIGVARYSLARRDRALAEDLLPHVERAMTWLAAHDSNNDGLLEIPEASDWMDLFPRSYNVLHDEVLWYQACLDHAALLEALGRDAEGWRAQAGVVRQRILELFWPSGRHLMELAGSNSGRFLTGEGHYLLSHITPFDHSWRCDVGANLLAALTDLLDEQQLERLFTFLWGVGVNSPSPVACLYPPVQSGAEDWKDYFMVNFLNLPDHYHNGGIWPFLGGLWVRVLSKLGRTELAHRELTSLAEACRQGIHDEWEFSEWLHGRTGRPMGKIQQSWSAASYIKAYKTLNEDTVPAEFDPLDPGRLD